MTVARYQNCRQCIPLVPQLVMFPSVKFFERQNKQTQRIPRKQLSEFSLKHKNENTISPDKWGCHWRGLTQKKPVTRDTKNLRLYAVTLVSQVPLYQPQRVTWACTDLRQVIWAGTAMTSSFIRTNGILPQRAARCTRPLLASQAQRATKTKSGNKTQLWLRPFWQGPNKFHPQAIVMAAQRERKWAKTSQIKAAVW